MTTIDPFTLRSLKTSVNRIVVGPYKEITKYFEEYFRFDVRELDQNNISLKGEITLVLSEKKIINKTSNILNESDKIKIRKFIKKLSIKEIVDIIKDGKNIPKKEIYNYCLKIKNEK